MLFDVVHEAEQAVPSNAGESVTVRIGTPPNEDRLAHDVIFRHKTPIAGVEGVVAVVTHHPIFCRPSPPVCCPHRYGWDAHR